MVKFFLRNDKNLPKSQLTKNKDKKQKTHKVTDFRIVIWKKMFNLIKAQHSIMIQKIIRKIKDKKRKLQKVEDNKIDNIQQKQEQVDENSDQNQNESKVKISSKISKQIQKLQSKYNELKAIKKQQLKKITLYIIMQILKIDNCDKIFQKYQMKKEDYIDQNQIKTVKKQNKIKSEQKSDSDSQEQKDQTPKPPSKLKKQVQNSTILKNFFSKLAMLTAYMTELQNCAQLLDVVQQKKLLKKGKLKQRKQRKYQKQKLQKQKQNQEAEEPKQIVQEQTQKKQELVKQNDKKFDHKERKENCYKSQKNYNKHNNKNFNDNKYENKNKFQSDRNQSQRFNKNNNPNNKFNKPIHKQFDQPRKQRTEFKKTGRNKVKYQKQQQKNKFKNQNNKGQQKQFKPFLAYKKQLAHPSWQAKQQLKQQVFIKPFQGKKIVF